MNKNIISSEFSLDNQKLYNFLFINCNCIITIIQYFGLKQKRLLQKEGLISLFLPLSHCGPVNP